MTPGASVGNTLRMGSVRKRLARQTRAEDPGAAREELLHSIAARLNAHRVKQYGDDHELSGVLLETAAALALNATPAPTEQEFSVAAINAYVEAKRQREGTDEDLYEGEEDDE